MYYFQFALLFKSLSILKAAPNPTLCSNGLAAQPSLQNGGFEAYSNCDGQSWCLSTNAALIAPWTVTSSNKNFELDNSPWANQEGSWSMDLSSDAPYTVGQCVQTQPGATYKLLFWLNVNPCGPDTKTGFAKTSSGAYMAFDESNGEGWELETMSFTATEAATMIEIGSTTEGGCGPVLDNVSLVTVSPPPTSTKCSNGLAAYSSLQNGGFEAHAYCDDESWCLSTNTDLIAPWLVTSSNKNFELDNTPWSNQEGSWSMDLSSDAPYTLGQCVQTQSGATYKLSFWLNVNPCGPDTKTGFAKTSSGAYMAFDKSNGEGWELQTMSFTATEAATMIEIGSTTEGGCGPVLDNVSMTVM
jgi:hypothetical protein